MDISRREFLAAVAAAAVLPAVGSSSPATWTVNRQNMWGPDRTSEEALARCNRILANDPNNVLALVHRGSVPEIYTDKAQAWADLNRAISLEPGNPCVNYIMGVAFDNAPALQHAISLLSMCGDVTGEAICSYPDHYEWRGTEAGELRYMSLRDLGYAEAAQGRFDEAVAAFEKAGQYEVISPKNLETWAESSFAVGTFARALVEFDRLIAVQPKPAYNKRRDECWARMRSNVS